MAITQVDKMKILKFFRENAFGEIYYSELVKYLGKKSKVTDIEFIDFFANYVLDSFNREQSSINLLNKMVSSLDAFIGWLHNDAVEIDFELLNKLYSIKEKYEEYLIRSKEEKNEKLSELIMTFESNLKKYYPLTKQEIAINIDELIAEISTLQKALSESEQEILSLTNQIEKQTRAYESKKKANTRLSSQLELSHTREKNLKEKIKELEESIEQLNNLIATLKTEITTSSERYSTLSDLKNKIQNDYFGLKTEIKKLRKTVEEKERQIEEISRLDAFKIIVPRSDDCNKNRENKIEALIIQKMLTGEYTLEQIQKYLKENDIIVTREELKNYFTSIKQKMTYTKTTVSTNISEDLKKENEYVVTIPDNTRCLDLMVVSDFHLSTFSKETMQDMDLINNYCTKNGINLILNVGDFFSWSRLERKHRGSDCQRIVDKAITKYPICNGIKHAILGGNHDKDMIVDGVDPIKLLADARDDFINLGYNHCKITFSGTLSILGSIGMHHPHRRYPEPVGDELYSTEKIENTINSYYVVNNLNHDDIYAELIGHIHKSGLNTENGICIVPSYRKDRLQNGAWHLKVYFNEANEISNIIFIPIIKTRKLIPTTEICYKKQLVLK